MNLFHRGTGWVRALFVRTPNLVVTVDDSEGAPNFANIDGLEPTTADSPTPERNNTMSYFPKQPRYRAASLPCGKTKVPALFDAEGRPWVALEAYLAANAEALRGAPVVALTTSCPSMIATADDGTDVLFVDAKKLGVLLGQSLVGFAPGPDEDAAAKKRETLRIVRAFEVRQAEAAAARAAARNGLISQVVQPVLEALKAELEAKGHELEIKLSGQPEPHVALIQFCPAGVSHVDRLHRYTLPRVEFYVRNDIVRVTTRGLGDGVAAQPNATQEYEVPTFTKELARGLALQPIKRAIQHLERTARIVEATRP
jgi:hypothetical protein